MPEHPRAVVFDLDGTLVETAADIHAVLAEVLAEVGLAAPTLPAVRGMIGDGARVLIERALAAIGATMPTWTRCTAASPSATPRSPAGTARPSTEPSSCWRRCAGTAGAWACAPTSRTRRPWACSTRWGSAALRRRRRRRPPARHPQAGPGPSRGRAGRARGIARRRRHGRRQPQRPAHRPGAGRALHPGELRLHADAGARAGRRRGGRRPGRAARALQPAARSSDRGDRGQWSAARASSRRMAAADPASRAICRSGVLVKA